MKSHARCEKHCSISRSRRGSNPIYYVVTLTDNTEDAENRFVDASNVTRISEIRCVTHMVPTNHSFNSQDDLADDLKAICHDSKILCKMKVHAKKATYLTYKALCPFVQEAVLSGVRSSDWFSLHVDETNYKQDSFRGIFMRYCLPQSLQIKTTCIDLPNLLSANAENIVNAILKVIRESRLDYHKCISVMIDKCHTMRGSQSAVLVRLKEHFLNIVDIGGCSLHHIHSVSKHACQELGNDIEELVFTENWELARSSIT